MVRPAGRARLPRSGRSARAGPRRAGERARIVAPGGRRAVGDRAPRAGAGAAAELSGPRDHGGPDASSSRGHVQGGQVLRGGRHRPAGTAPPPPPRPRLGSRRGRALGCRNSGLRCRVFAGLASRRLGRPAEQAGARERIWSLGPSGGDLGGGLWDPGRGRVEVLRDPRLCPNPREGRARGWKSASESLLLGVPLESSLGPSVAALRLGEPATCPVAWP